MKYKASVEISGVLEQITFETEGNPIEYLWSKYGMSSFIEWLIKEDDDIK